MKILEIENYGKALKEVSHVRQTSFIELYNLIMEHATGLFTPATLLKLIMNKLHEYPEVVLTKQELLRYSNCDSYKYFNDIINSLKFQDNYELHILHIYRYHQCLGLDLEELSKAHLAHLFLEEHQPF